MEIVVRKEEKDYRIVEEVAREAFCQVCIEKDLEES